MRNLLIEALMIVGMALVTVETVTAKMPGKTAGKMYYIPLKKNKEVKTDEAVYGNDEVKADVYKNEKAKKDGHKRRMRKRDKGQAGQDSTMTAEKR